MYYTKVKHTSYAGFGITEGQIIATISMLVTAFLGQDFWTETLRYIFLVPIILVESYMVGYALIDTLKFACNTPVLLRFHELFPLVQFLGLSYIMTYTEFFVQYPALAYVIMSLLFYLQNGKLVLASVAETKMSLFHLELFYLWLPSIALFISKMGWVDRKLGKEIQIWSGFLVMVLVIERTITCSIILTRQVTKKLGYGFFDVPRPIETPGYNGRKSN